MLANPSCYKKTLNFLKGKLTGWYEVYLLSLILCAESSREQIELLEMHKDGIMVAEYWTELPPKKQLEKKIHSILIEAKERIDRNKLSE